MEISKGCNRCMYTWQGEEVYCPMCGNLFTHMLTKENTTIDELIKKGYIKESERDKWNQIC